MATDPTNVPADDLLEGGLDVLHRKALTILKRIRDSAVDPETGQKRAPTFPISKAASLVGRTASAIREAERDGRLPERGRTASGHRVQYTLSEPSSTTVQRLSAMVETISHTSARSGVR